MNKERNELVKQSHWCLRFIRIYKHANRSDIGYYCDISKYV